MLQQIVEQLFALQAQLFQENTFIVFSYNAVNSVGNSGGSIYMQTSNITFEGNTTVIFSNNHAELN